MGVLWSTEVRRLGVRGGSGAASFLLFAGVVILPAALSYMLSLSREDDEARDMRMERGVAAFGAFDATRMAPWKIEDLVWFTRCEWMCGHLWTRECGAGERARGGMGSGMKLTLKGEMCGLELDE